MNAMKTKVRVAIAVDSTGTWNACGWGGPDSKASDSEKMGLAVDGVADGEARYWLEAEVDLPTDATPLDAVVVPA
jgi:hypothetical protein